MRNRTFESPARRALANHPKAQLKENDVKGPISFFNPTRARFNLPSSDTVPTEDNSNYTPNVTPPAVGDAQYEWRSRDNRKGKGR